MFVLPSYTENFGLAVIEAMAAGLPIIISDKVNIWREVESAGAGTVIPCEAEKLTEAILSYWINPNWPGRWDKRGKRSSGMNFNGRISP